MSERKFAVFDIDGTLIRWQLYHATVDKLANKGALGKGATEELHKARMIWKRREHRDAWRTYEMALIGVYEAALPTLSHTVFDETVDEVINEYKDQAYTYTRNLITSLKEKNYVLLAISGSHQELVEKVAEYYGFDDCIGTHYARNQTSFSGEKTHITRDKKKVLNDMVTKHNLSFKDSVGVGDSASDASMLKIVEQPIAFNPDQALLEIAQEHHWPIILERKNVVYKLEPQNGKYFLA